MNIKEVKDLIQDILQSDISEFELEHTGTKVRLRRGFAPGEGTTISHPHVLARPLPAGREADASAAGALASSAAREEAASEEGLHIITSPIVGTFYRAPAPGAEPYTKIGAKVEVGTILCIVEAMKLMNEIPSDVAGEIVEIHTENGHPVEFGQKLFAIRQRK
ncbi:MAG: acetyl-CoA carboxylase biotin carboxyl carrier protein [Acidobacteriia bacterium]|nr:acetyl-CoA carboxylase biotin carboxyl carrier protein [Terriglobia bacterium]